MAASIYVYEDIEEYIKHYKQKLNSELGNNSHALKITDMYLRGEQLFVIVDSNNLVGRPDMTRSRVILDSRMKDKFFRGDEVLVKHGDVSFTFKNSKLHFMKKILRKPKLTLRIDKYHGNKQKSREKINTSIRFYDFELNRIILIQK